MAEGDLVRFELRNEGELEGKKLDFELLEENVKEVVYEEEKKSKEKGTIEGKEEFEEENDEENQLSDFDYGEGKFPEVIPDKDIFYEEDTGEYGEGGNYLYFTTGEGDEQPSAWGDVVSSETSEPSIEASEVEETEEEREQKREKEMLIDTLRQKIMSRMLLRRRNIFLHKKLVEHFKKRRMENVLKEEPKGLDLESKYLRKLYAYQDFKEAQKTEIEELTEKMKRLNLETNELQDQLDAKLTNFVIRAKEVSLNLVSSKTGKKLNEKIVDRLLKRHVQNCEEKGKKKLRYIKIKNLIEEKEHQLKSMEYFGEGLNIVDYEQMKIDNQNYTDKIEEKEDELTKMRIKTEGIMQNLAHVREKNNAVEGDIELMEEKVYDVEKRFREKREGLTKARKKRDSLREELAQLKLESGLLSKDSLLRDFENSIYEAKNLSRQLEKTRKSINEKKKQENELAKMVTEKNFDLPWELKLLGRSKSRIIYE